MTLQLLAPSLPLATLVVLKWDVTFQPKEKGAGEAEVMDSIQSKKAYTDFNGLFASGLMQTKVIYEG